MVCWDLGGSRLEWIQLSILIVGIRVYVAQVAIPARVPAKSVKVVDTPSNELVVQCQGNCMHTTAGKLDDAELGWVIGVKVWVDTRLKSFCLFGPETKLAVVAIAKDADYEDFSGSLVDGRKGSDRPLSH